MGINKIFNGILLSSIPFVCIADEILEKIEIRAEQTYTKTTPNGKTTINEQNIKNFPKGNGNINDVLTYMPDIKTSGNIETSKNAGEIEPQNLSISGAKFYNNNFMIDGISNNSLLDPANSNPNQINDVKGHPQEIFIDSSMIKSIDVYDSDVPAKFGNFLGGVVDAKTKHSQNDFSGTLSYRHTSDKLTKFFVPNKDEFAYSNSSSSQPKFSKDFYGLNLNIPIGETDGLYLDAMVKKSIIPLRHFGKEHQEERISQNYLAKYSKYLDSGDVVDVVFTYAPYEERRFLKNIQQSDFTIKGGGIKTAINHEKETTTFKSNTTISYSQTENSRNSPQHFYNWAVSDTFPWGNLIDSEVSHIGGYGNIEKKQNILTLKTDFELKNYFDFGVDIQKGFVGIDRKEDSAIYKVGSDNSSSTPHPKSGIANLKCYGNDGCIGGEQYANSKDMYKKYLAEVDILNTAFYLQKKFDLNNFDATLGLRYDYNDYMENHDIAYRSVASFDLFDDKNTIFSIGANRYYSNSFLTYKLREAQKPYVTYTRALLGGYDLYGNQIVRVGEWEENSRRGTNKTRYNELRTPYSDEISYGFSQKIFNGIFIAKKIFRDNNDEFSKTYGVVENDGYRYYSLSNDGKSKHESMRISYENNFGNHSFSLNFNRSKTSQTNETYDDTQSDTGDGVVYFAYYDNRGKKQYKELLKNELKEENDTKPDTYKLFYKYDFDNRLNLSTFVTYTTSYKKLDATTETKEYTYSNPVTGEYSWQSAPVYEIVKYDSYTNVDLSLAYTQPLTDKQKLVFKTDIKNLMNKQQKASATTNDYALGRQIWLEINYKF